MRPEIRVFRTNIKREDAKIVANYFNGLRNLVEWSVDYEDVDNVLRIVLSQPISNEQIQNNLANHGFECSEL